MLNRLQGQPESYDKKSKYRFGKTLGAGTYGIVREGDGPTGKVAIKIILKKNVKGNEQMVWDELDMLRRIQHPNIVRFVDWFESRDKYYIVMELATGGELFDRICEQGKFTEKDASQTIKQVLEAVDYLHSKNVVHRGECTAVTFLILALALLTRRQISSPRTFCTSAKSRTRASSSLTLVSPRCWTARTRFSPPWPALSATLRPRSC